MDFPRLRYFLRTYLSVEESPNRAFAALRKFIIGEGAEAARGLQADLRNLLSQDFTSADLKAIFEKEGLYSVGEKQLEVRQVLIDLFEGVQQSAPVVRQAQKPYDVFISYSSADRKVATRLATALKEKGYAVWLDSWEILVGHNIVDEVYRGIAESEFLVVVLTNQSSKSKWVQEELSTAKISEIEARKVTVLPAKFEKCEIPVSLRNKRYADFVESWDEGLRALTTAIDLHRSSSQPPVSISLPGATFNALKRFRDQVLQQTPKASNGGYVGYKDVIIGPPDGVSASVEKTRLTSLVDACRPNIAGWGGPSFPYAEARESTQEVRMPDWTGVLDQRPWPYRTRSLHFWAIDQRPTLFSRTHWDEDYLQFESDDLKLSGTVGLSWALIDIVRPLLFARNLLLHEKRVGSLGVQYSWTGLQNRVLRVIDRRRMQFTRQYRCDVAEWNPIAKLELDSDLLKIAKETATDLFWLFHWDEPGPMVLEDLQKLIGGSVP